LPVFLVDFVSQMRMLGVRMSRLYGAFYCYDIAAPLINFLSQAKSMEELPAGGFPMTLVRCFSPAGIQCRDAATAAAAASGEHGERTNQLLQKHFVRDCFVGKHGRVENPAVLNPLAGFYLGDTSERKIIFETLDILVQEIWEMHKQDAALLGVTVPPI
jgi:hypothetical protein